MRPYVFKLLVGVDSRRDLIECPMLKNHQTQHFIKTFENEKSRQFGKGYTFYLQIFIFTLAKNVQNDNFLFKIDFLSVIQDSRPKTTERIYSK